MGINVAREIDIQAEDSIPVYDAKSLTKEGDLARIHLTGQIYTLRITRAGKLILTK